MTRNWIRNIKKYGISKRLAVAVTASLLAGSYAVGALAAEYNQTITGDNEADTAYADIIIKDMPDSGEWRPKDYQFNDGDIINGSANAAIDSKSEFFRNYAVGVKSGTLILNSIIDGVDDNYGIKHNVSEDMNLKIAADNVNINVAGNGKVYGVSALNDGFFSESKVIFYDKDIKELSDKTKVNISAQGKKGAVGIYVADGGAVTVNGSLNMTGNAAQKWGVDGGTSADLSTVGIYVNGGSSIMGNKVTVYGHGDLAVNGTGLLAKGGNAKITFQKGASISSNQEDSNVNYAIAADGGTIKINADDSSDSSVIKGNIGLLENGGGISLALNDAKSSLEGVIFHKNADGSLELQLQNGAVWNNVVFGTVDSSFAGSTVDKFKGKDSYIYQKDSNPLTIKNYSGNAIVFYEHTGDGTSSENYAAGDTVIEKADAGSNIIISTDNTGIAMSSKTEVAKALNALAGKLIYSDYVNGETSLDGKVQIADGLTASSAALATGAVTFNKDDGRGSYPVNLQTDFSTSITGDMVADKQYVDAEVLKTEGIYNFAKGETININAGESPAINTVKAVEINAEKGSLNLAASASADSAVSAVRHTVDGTLTINADELNITAVNKAGSSGSTRAIEISNKNKSIKPNLVVNGNINLSAKNENNKAAFGIYAEGPAAVTVNGDVVINNGKDGEWALDGKNDDTFFNLNSAGLYTKSNNSFGSGVINVNGNVDMAVNGNGMLATGEKGSINVKGGSITTNKDKTGLYAVVATEGGTVKVNDTAADTAVNINGNIGVISGLMGSFGMSTADVKLGLATADSSLHGVIYNSFNDLSSGKSELTLKNGAVWTNETYGKIVNDEDGLAFNGSRLSSFIGGSDEAHAGVILQKDSNKLSIDKYSGNAVIVYEHTGDGTTAADYAAGDTVIRTAETGSQVTLSTDNSGINMKDTEVVNKALNALAGKLTYTNYTKNENNLSGMVQIADGLTASSVLMKKDITFDESSGKGSYVPPTGIVEHMMPILEDNYIGGSQREYWNNKYVRTVNGKLVTYRFDNDTNLSFTTDKNLAGQQQQKGLGTISWAGSNDGVVDMTDHKLTIVADGHNSVAARERPSGIKVDSGKLEINNSKGLDIVVKNGNYVDGAIFVEGTPSEGAWNNGDGNAHLVINNGDDTEDAVNLRFENCSGTKYGIYVNKNSGTAALNIKGLLDLEADGFTAVMNYGGNTYIGGGNISSNNSDALETRGGSLLVNAEFDENGNAAATSNNRNVNINGNITNMLGGKIGIALNNKKSSFAGVVNTEAGSKTALLVANNALWTNSSNHDIDNWNGSHISSFSGGSSTANAGYILQKDSKNLTIDNYSGNAVIMYEHIGNGSKAENYTAGDTVINSAAAGSNVVLSTDNSGIDMTDTAQVGAVLNSLAGKLTYNAYTDANGSERNLNGKVQIADGLTASSVSMATGNIKFSEDNGKGSYLPESKFSFTQTITGDKSADSQYTAAGILVEEGQYNFADGAEVEIAAGTAPAINMEKAVTINSANGTLNLKAEGNSGKSITAVSNTTAGNLLINAAKVNVSAVNTDTLTGAKAIEISNKNTSRKPTAEINALVNITAQAAKTAYGIFAEGPASVTINNDVVANSGEDGKWALSGSVDDNAIENSSAALYAGQSSSYGSGVINVNGNVDFAVNGHGIVAVGNGAVINTKGGSIVTNVSSSNGLYALAASKDGIVNMNVSDGNAGSSKVNINGNIGVLAGVYGAFGMSGATVNLGLTTEKSTLNGVIYNSYKDLSSGKSNLWLQNGATWINEKYGKLVDDNAGLEMDFDGSKVTAFKGSSLTNFVGGSDAAHAGVIFQKDSNPLTIKNYSGNAMIIYEHTGNGGTAENYKAGDTIINKAAENSSVTLSTDNSDINMQDNTEVGNVLNALAGKLTYTNYAAANGGERNLNGIVQIADGLTASSVAMKTGNITFSDSDGKGSYVQQQLPEHQTESEFSQTITGIAEQDEVYLLSGVLKEDGRYIFEKNSNITLSDGSKTVDVQGDVDINAEGSTLNLKTSGGSTVVGVNQTSGHKAAIKADKLNITSQGSYRAEGLHVQSGSKDVQAVLDIDADTDIKAIGDGYALGAYANGNAVLNLNGNTVMKAADGSWAVDDQGNGYSYYGSSALYAGSDYNIQKGAVINAKNVDLAVNGNGAFANGGGSTVNIEGGIIKVNGERELYALLAQSGYVNMNVNEAKDASAGHDVNLLGNIGVLNGSVNNNEKEKLSEINLGLDTAASSLNGVIVNNFTQEQLDKGYSTAVNLFMSNGANWTNEAYGSGTLKDFAGSTVNKFTGGSDAASAGNIFQKDSNKLVIDNYSGYTNIYYEHTGDGTLADNYTAGDTIVKSAAAGSGISLITDNSGIRMDNVLDVNKALDTLAGKLTYMNFTMGENNLTGLVKIADGLTASSAAKQTGVIEFDSETGKGGLKADSVTPGISNPSEQQTDKFNETITGNDTYYQQQGVQKEDGSYVFSKNPSEVTVSEGAAVNAGKHDIVIDSSKAELRLNAKEQGILADGKNVTITGNTSVSGSVGIQAAGGSVILNGSTNINGTAAAIKVAEGGRVEVGNGVINGDIIADGNEAGIIVNDGDKAEKTQLKGNIAAANGADVEIFLNGAASSLTGGYTADSGNIALNIKNGAVWHLTDGEAAVGDKAAFALGTLTVNGGADKAATGYLDMTKRTKDLKINNYSGWETVIYNHNNDGSKVTDYTSGNTVIDKAASGSGVVLSTDNSGIDMNSKTAVENTLKALAQKVIYNDAAANAANLTGKVQIADGLTSASKYMYLGDMKWDADNKGQYVEDSIDWSNNIIGGDYETFIMKGIRSAATTSLHTWRDNMADSYKAADLADEDGIFAKVLGGKTSSDVKGASDSNTYYGVQVGYDKVSGNGWHTGIAFDYRDGDSTYLLGGEGDNQMYSLGIYGVKNFTDNSYLRIAGKVGRVENEYDVYNEIRTLKLHGNYKANAYGLNVEYGRTFGEDKAYITPIAKLTWSQVGSKSYTAHTDKASMFVNQDSYQSLVGRVGLEAGTKNGKGNAYMGFFAAHEFNGDISASYLANDGGMKHTNFDGGDDWFELTLGGNYNLSKNSHIYAEFARDFGGDFQRKWKASAGLRFEF